MNIRLALSSVFLAFVFTGGVGWAIEATVGEIPVEYAFVNILLWAGLATAWYHKNAIGRYLGRRYATLTH